MTQRKETHAQRHCERSVAIARLLNCTSNAITTSDIRPPRNDKRTAFTLAEGATHVDTCDNVRRFAFTLAEVLITLAIIGVVAAMTIPTLITNYQKVSQVTKFKKAYATLDNGFKLMLAQEGVEYFAQTQLSKDFAAVDGANSIEDALNNNITKYFKTSEICYSESETGCPMYSVEYKYLNGEGEAGQLTGMPYFTLSDGAVVYMVPGYISLLLYLDTNGKQGPNLLGRDLFTLYMGDGPKGFVFGPHLRANTAIVDPTVEINTDYFEQNPEACGVIGSEDISQAIGAGCADRIILEGWEMNY